jgi:hypothetical protein
LFAPDLQYGSRQCTQRCSPAALICHCITVSYISLYVINPMSLPGANLPCSGTPHSHSQSFPESHSDSELDIACTLHSRMFAFHASFNGFHVHKFTGDIAGTHAASPIIANCRLVHMLHRQTSPTTVAKCTTARQSVVHGYVHINIQENGAKRNF